MSKVQAAYWGWLVIPIVAAALLPPDLSRSQSQAPSSWLKPDAPVVSTIKAVITPDALPVYGDADCSPQTTFVTIPKNILNLQPEVSHNTCAITTAYGQYGISSGDIKLYGTDIAGPVKTNTGANFLVSAIPNSSHLMSFSASLYGSTRSILKDFSKNMDTVVEPNGSIFHRLKSGVASQEITDAGGTPLPFTETRFSSNGKWMVGDIHQHGMARVNIETGETLLFGEGYNHAVGTRPQFVSAISGNGRFVFTTAAGYDIAKIYDLSTCVPQTGDPLKVSCQFKDLLPFFRQRFSNFQDVHYAQFSTDYSLRLYLRYDRGTYGYFSLTANGEKESLIDYLATGDSFASGEGTFSYKPGTDVRNPSNSCHLSLVSYPYLLAARTNLNSVQSVACSGARIKDIVSNSYPEELAQAKGKNSSAEDNYIFSDYLVGYRPQLAFVERAKPGHLTISIGGNDIGFSKIIMACLAPGNCYDNPQDRLDLAYTIETQYSRLVSVYENLRQQASTGARIYAVGYPSLATPNGNCALNVRLSQPDIELANQIVAYLNSVIKRAAQKAGVSYIDVEQALAGYRLCETKSSGVAVNGLTLGDDKTFSLSVGSNYTLDGYFIGRETYHPNRLGHRLLSDAIAGATHNFSQGNPDPVASPPELVRPNPFSSGGSGLHPKKIIFEDTLVDGILALGQNYRLQVKELQPESGAILRIGSELIETSSQLKASASGELNAGFTLPSVSPTGLQVVHLQAKNRAGEDIDIQKVAYIAQNLDDIDGDGIDNGQEECLATDPANADSDRDDVDDACDNLINDPPPVIVPPEPGPAPPIPEAGQAAQAAAGGQYARLAGQMLTPAEPAVLSAAADGAASTKDKNPISEYLLKYKSPLGLAAIGMSVSGFLWLVYSAQNKWRKRS